MISRPFFKFADDAHAYESGHVASGHFVFGRDVLCEFDYCLLVAMLQEFTKFI